MGKYSTKTQRPSAMALRQWWPYAVVEEQTGKWKKGEQTFGFRASRVRKVTRNHLSSVIGSGSFSIQFGWKGYKAYYRLYKQNNALYWNRSNISKKIGVSSALAIVGLAQLHYSTTATIFQLPLLLLLWRSPTLISAHYSSSYHDIVLWRNATCTMLKSVASMK